MVELVEMLQQQTLMHMEVVVVVDDIHNDEIDEQIVLLELHEHLMHIDHDEYDELVQIDELLLEEVVVVVLDSIK